MHKYNRDGSDICQRAYNLSRHVRHSLALRVIEDADPCYMHPCFDKSFPPPPPPP